MSPSKKLLSTLTSECLREVGTIAVLTGSIEFYLERVLWKLNGEKVNGQRPSTARDSVSQLINKLQTCSKIYSVPELQQILNLWTQIAYPAFKCRNSILHGLPIIYNRSITQFITNTRREGEIRERESMSFHVNENTLLFLSSIFQTLLDSLIAIQDILDGSADFQTLFTKEVIASMYESRSLANEIVDLAVAVNHEKY